MSKQVKYIIKNDKTNEVYANGEFVEMYDGEEFTLFDTEDEAKQFIHSLDISDVDNEELDVYLIDVYENVWVHYQEYTDFEVIPEEDIIISDEFGVITIRKYHDKAHKAEGYQSDWTGNECYCIVTDKTS